MFRIINDFGISPIFAIIVGLALFIYGSEYLFQKIEFATYAYGLIAVLVVGNLAEIKRNDFLKSCFDKNNFYKIRIVENLLIVLPFLIFLIYKQQYLIALLLSFFASIQAVVFSFQNKLTLIVPTPFYKNPFEFIVGFRKNWFLLIPLYFVLFKSIQVQNPNLGMFVLLVCFLSFISFFFKVEDQFYVWIYNKNPKTFLLEKFKNAILQSCIITLPISIILVFFFPAMWYSFLIIIILGNLLLLTAIVGKYAFYPSEINFIQSLALIICLVFPPFLFLVFPYFYSLATKKLSYILK